LSRTCESEPVSSDWQCEEIDALSETEKDEEFDCCNSENQSSSVADADTFSETEEECDNKNENTEERLTAWLLVLIVFFLLWIFMLAMFSYTVMLSSTKQLWNSRICSDSESQTQKIELSFMSK